MLCSFISYAGLVYMECGGLPPHVARASRRTPKKQAYRFHNYIVRPVNSSKIVPAVKIPAAMPGLFLVADTL